jgi:hypothetical protein
MRRPLLRGSDRLRLAGKDLRVDQCDSLLSGVPPTGATAGAIIDRIRNARAEELPDYGDGEWSAGFLRNQLLLLPEGQACGSW